MPHIETKVVYTPASMTDDNIAIVNWYPKYPTFTAECTYPIKNLYNTLAFHLSVYQGSAEIKMTDIEFKGSIKQLFMIEADSPKVTIDAKLYSTNAQKDAAVASILQKINAYFISYTQKNPIMIHSPLLTLSNTNGATIASMDILKNNLNNPGTYEIDYIATRAEDNKKTFYTAYVTIAGTPEAVVNGQIKYSAKETALTCSRTPVHYYVVKTEDGNETNEILKIDGKVRPSFSGNATMCTQPVGGTCYSQAQLATNTFSLTDGQVTLYLQNNETSDVTLTGAYFQSN